MNKKEIIFIYWKKYLTWNWIKKVKIHKILIPFNNSYIELSEFIEKNQWHKLVYKLTPIFNKIKRYTKSSNNNNYWSINLWYINEIIEIIWKDTWLNIFKVEI